MLLIKWAFIKLLSKSNKRMSSRAETQSEQNLVIPYMGGISEKLKWIFGKHHIALYFKLTNTKTEACPS